MRFRNQIITVLAVVMILGIIGFGCTSPRGTSTQASPSPSPVELSFEGKEVDQSANGFTITVPEDWEIQERDKGNGFSAISAKENTADNFMENIGAISGDSEGYTLQKMLDDNLADLPTALENYKQISVTDATLDGVPAKRLVYNHEYEGIPLQVLQYFTIKDKRMFILTATARTDSFKKYEKTFEEIFSTFKFAK